MKTVRDRDLLDRIGCHGRHEYAFIDDSVDARQDSDDGDLSEFAMIETENAVDNSGCDADFDSVENGYAGQPGFMRGVLFRMEKKPEDSHSRCIGIYSADGMYRMESKRGVTYYPGRNGRARCIAIPQCKMMNSTVLDMYARHVVYVGEDMQPGNRCNRVYRGHRLTDANEDGEWLGCRGFDIEGSHVPFDLWCVMGVVFGKALRIWRGVAKLDMRRMPTWMYVELPELFEALNPGCRWCDLSDSSRLHWRHGLVDSFRRMNRIALAWDLPVEDGSRDTHVTRHMLENSLVSHRVDSSDEPGCLAEWNDVYEPCGFKVRVRGNAIFDFCWRRGLNSPSVVQVRDYEHDVSKVMGSRGWTCCFHMIWASWLVQYRNYWKRRGGGYESCVLEWSQREMLRAFEGSVFGIRHLSTEEMVGILTYHTCGYVDSHKGDRPAHIGSVSVERRCVVSWTLPRNLAGEAVLVKNEQGVNMSLDEAGISNVPQDVVVARSRMEEINEANMRHVVTMDGRRIDVCESVIYRCRRDANGVVDGVWDRNGRCYSMRNGVQALKRAERKRLLIDGHATREVDYSSLHPHMLYALNGLSFSGDVYDVGRWYLKYGVSCEDARVATKMMMLRLINARNSVVAMKSFKKAWNLMNGLNADAFVPWLHILKNAIMKRHAAISHEFCTGKGVYLMNMDGRLIREVCHRLAREGICSLGIHDSVVVESRHACKAVSVMKEEYSRMFNGCTIGVKY